MFHIINKACEWHKGLIKEQNVWNKPFPEYSFQINWKTTFIIPTCDIFDICKTERDNRVRAQFDITTRCGCSTRCWIVMSPLDYVFQNNKSVSGWKVNVKLFKCIHMEIPCAGASDGKEFGAPRGPRMQSHFIWLWFFSSGTFSNVKHRNARETQAKWTNESRRWLLSPEWRHDWRMIIIRYTENRQHFDEVSGYKIHTHSVF